MCLTGMHANIWQVFPFLANGEAPGWGSDLNLCRRLKAAGIVPVAPKSAYVHHVKERWNCADKDPKKRLLWERPQEVIFEPLETT